MTRRAIYDETTNSAVTDQDFKDIHDAAVSWHNGSDQIVQEVSRNVISGRASIRLMLTGRTDTQLESALAQLDTAATNLVGDWPVPSEEAFFQNE